ncbi:hypothetical protein O3M35_000893 [Rhynocoris fuscipes]|uniref:F-box domain-containing protein n=1 Tax=Rhynocoris fuscipes TaxID=488301 RepID=A0AAW1DSF7_9HEMI
MDIIGQLPIEIAQEIFTYLSATDLSKCCQVSKTWRAFANSDLLWRDICLKKGIICELEYYHEGRWELEPMVDWAQAYMSYVRRRFSNWRKDRKTITTINSCYDTIACCSEDTLVFTNASNVIFIYNISRRKPFGAQIIHPECVDKEILSLNMCNNYLIVRQGDSFSVYYKDNHEFKLKGFLLRHEDSYVYTKHYYETNEGPGFIRFCIIENGLCILVGKSLFICKLSGLNIEIHSVGILDQSLLLHDKYRAFVITDYKTVTGFDVKLNYDDFYLQEYSLIAIKSNKNIVIGLLAAENSLYDFKVWSLKYDRLLRTYRTHRPFGFEVHPKLNLFSSVSLDKFNRRVLLTIYDLIYNISYEVDLNDLAIAQVRLSFIGNDLLYCATRSDWDIYDTTYLLDLSSMRILYENDIGQVSIVSVDSKHAVYLHGEAIEIHTYID